MSRPNLLSAITFLFALAGVSQPASADQTPLSLDDAKHLLFRTGFGATVGDLNRLTGKPREQAVDLIINGIRPAPELPMPSWTKQPAPHHWATGKLPKQKRRIFNESRDREIASLKVWWVRQIIETDSPQTERLALMWHNHFATAYSDINSQSIAIARQHQLFREHSTGYFGTLLKHMIRDPALLNYLDNDKSRKNSPNENLARELMELFTLGEGNYTEADVKNAARALTGYSVEPLHNLQFRFKPFAHDKSNKTIFGQTGQFNGDDLVDLILQQPHTAIFIAQRFWQTYISDIPAAPAVLQPLASTFRDSGYNLLTLYRATLLSDAFWHPDNRASIIRSPVSLVLGTIRSTAITPSHWQTLPTVLANMGQDLFDPPNVAGWPGGGHWVTPSRLLYRMEWLEQLAKSCAGAGCNTETATDMMATPMNTMSEPSSPSDGGTMMSRSDTAAGKLISIRLAAEEFDDAVQYQLSIYRAEEKLWTTGRVSVVGGHDNKSLGRMKLDQDIPWQTVQFKVDVNTTDFDKIEVEFLNDAASNGNDRNLFIDQVTFDDEQFLAATGSQNSSCTPKQPHYAGRLYCNGTLALQRKQQRTLQQKQLAATINDSASSSSFKPHFTAEGVYLQTAQSPVGKNKHLGIALTNVTLNGRYWHTINARFYKVNQRSSKNTRQTDNSQSATDTYALRLNSFNCWPACVQQWPQCAARSKNDPDLRTLTFPLITNVEKGHCHYQSLAADDQALIDALWHNIDQLFQLATDNIPATRQRLLDNSARWTSHIDSMSRQYKNSRYNKTGIPLLQTVTPDNTVSVGEDSIVSSTPLSAGQTKAQRDHDWIDLVNKSPGVSLQSLLLPAPALTKTDNASLHEVLTDLYLQLQ